MKLQLTLLIFITQKYKREYEEIIRFDYDELKKKNRENAYKSVNARVQ